jgi:hypothetical protein
VPSMSKREVAESRADYLVALGRAYTTYPGAVRQPRCLAFVTDEPLGRVATRLDVKLCFVVRAQGRRKIHGHLSTWTPRNSSARRRFLDSAMTGCRRMSGRLGRWIQRSAVFGRAAMICHLWPDIGPQAGLSSVKGALMLIERGSAGTCAARILEVWEMVVAGWALRIHACAPFKRRA